MIGYAYHPLHKKMKSKCIIFKTNPHLQINIKLNLHD
jgi:hypothetical protein